MQKYHGKLSKTEECRICPEESSTYKENFHTFPHSKQGKTPHSTNDLIIFLTLWTRSMLLNVLWEYNECLWKCNYFKWIFMDFTIDKYELKFCFKKSIYSNPFPKLNYFIKLKHNQYLHVHIKFHLNNKQKNI